MAGRRQQRRRAGANLDTPSSSKKTYNTHIAAADVQLSHWRKRGPHAIRVYLARHFFALLFGLVVVAVSAAVLVADPFWTLYLRAALLLRVTLSLLNMLSICAFGNFQLMALYLVGEDCASLASTSSDGLLYASRIIDIIERFILQPMSLIGNFASLIHPPPEPSLLRLGLDLAWIIESRISTLLIYELGIKNNVYNNVLRRKRYARVVDV